MQITIQQILNTKMGLEPLLSQDVPLKTSYKIMKFYKQIEEEIDTFFSPKFKQICKECNSEDTPNGSKIPTDKQEEFNIRYSELLNLEIELTDFSVTLDELENAKLTPQQIYLIDQFIIE